MKKVTLILNDGFDDVVQLPPTDCNLTKGKIIK